MKDQRVSGFISWVYTEDLESTTAFYGGSLNLNLVRDEGSAHIYKVTPTASIGVCRAFENRVVEPAGGMITLVVDDVNEWYRSVTQRGVQPKSPPHVLDQFGIYTLLCRRP